MMFLGVNTKEIPWSFQAYSQPRPFPPNWSTVCESGMPSAKTAGQRFWHLLAGALNAELVEIPIWEFPWAPNAWVFLGKMEAEGSWKPYFTHGDEGQTTRKQLLWWRVFSLPSAGWGLTTPPCLGFWLELVRNMFFFPLKLATWSSKRWECRRVVWTPKSVLIFANVRSSFCSRFLFTCISSACFAGETTLRQINENWSAQMVDLYENGFEAWPSQNFV